MGIYDLTVKRVDGTEQTLAAFQGQVLLVVNTASKCGYTPQYKGLQMLYDQYHASGLTVLGFPCNQFGGQEPGSNEDVQQFCALNYSVTFPLFAKIEVNGENAHPFYQYLKSNTPDVGTEQEDIKWNFTKFLVSRNGAVIKRYSPDVEPLALANDIEQALRG